MSLVSKREAKRMKNLNDTQRLNELLDYGFGYRGISEATKISVPTLKQLRQSDESDMILATSQRNRLLEFLVACSHIQGRYGVEDVASWFESKLHAEASLTPLFLYSRGAIGLLLCILRKDMETEDAFLVFDSKWREKYTSDYETFMSQDGQLSIRKK